MSSETERVEAIHPPARAAVAACALGRGRRAQRARRQMAALARAQGRKPSRNLVVAGMKLLPW